MALYTRIYEDMKSTMRAQDKVRLAVIRFVISKIKDAAKDLKVEPEKLEDDQVLEFVKSTIKQYRDELQENEKAGRAEGVVKINADIDVLMEYMPEQLTEDQVREIVTNLITDLNIQGKAQMGKLMGPLMKQINGKFDGKKANQIVQELLA